MTPQPQVRKRGRGSSISHGTPKVRKTNLGSVDNELVAEEDRRVLSTGGSVLVFGEGVSGQLGLGEDVTEKGRPTAVPGLDNVIDVCAGGMHTVCLTKENKVITFGCNDEGALGRDTSEEGSEFTPGPVDIPGKVVQISAGDSHTAALLDSGAVYVWGSFRDAHGAMGLLNSTIEKRPVLLSLKGVKITRISSGSHHLAMLSTTGQIYTAGCGEQGQLGRVGERHCNRESRRGIGHLLEPGLVTFGSKTNKLQFLDVWTGSFCTFAKEKDGHIYVFGLNNYNQIGLEDPGVHHFPVVSKCFEGVDWDTISGGEHHTVALDRNGRVYTMGRKEYGRLGLGENCEDAVKPTAVETLANMKVVDVTCGSFATFALADSGKLYSWGMGSLQLGLGEEEDVFTPEEVKGKQIEKKRVARVSSGGQHTVIIASNS